MIEPLDWGFSFRKLARHRTRPFSKLLCGDPLGVQGGFEAQLTGLASRCQKRQTMTESHLPSRPYPSSHSISFEGPPKPLPLGYSDVT